MKRSIDYFEFKSLSEEDRLKVIEDRGFIVKVLKTKTIFKVDDYYAEVVYKKPGKVIKEIKVLYTFKLN
jgi:hypothetical protein